MSHTSAIHNPIITVLLLCCYPACPALPELGEALLDLLMEIVNIAPAQ